ncbi:MAG TPA: MFS transporter [Noviherbaspirillum sp.]|uniref:NTP/NDP exchange transporter n=1 Tax=Noviherbaspirillum sp. TaxID=1926288 RepID=UPI002D735A80|nr:MFS transporter [Noviherbaspirillum sp.]HYD95932.1 MFS transporter [Noviherbaspirillum sp.]
MKQDAARAAMVPGDLPRVACAFAGFFLLLCSYYILRPVRDEMAVRFGTGKLQWLFTATFLFTLLVVPLFGWAVRTLPRRRVLPLVYGFLAVNLAGFQAVFSGGATPAAAAAFFVWLSVFNLFIVSLFWSRMGDCFTSEESHRLYGYIAAGGTCGALAGPATTALLARQLSAAGLIALSTALLVLAMACLLPLRAHGRAADQSARPVGGSIVAGIPLVAGMPDLRALALLVLCYTAVSTTLYMEMVRAVGAAFGAAGDRTRFFASVDLAVNLLALGLQLLGTRRLVVRFGLRIALPLVPLLVGAGLVLLGIWPAIAVIACLQVAHRAGEYALGKPGREMIYTGLDAESRYKAKNFIDTAVYRGGDAASAWGIAALRSAGLDAVFFAALPAALAWVATARRLGARHDRNQST